MISSQVLLNTIKGIKGISHFDLCVMGDDASELAETDHVFEEAKQAVLGFVSSPADSQQVGPYQYFKVFDDSKLCYILVVYGNSDSALLVGKMAAYQLEALLDAYKEHFDREGFMKNLLLDNLLLVDIYERAKRLHIKTNVRRVVYLVQPGHGAKDRNAQEALQNMSSISTDDFVTQVDEDYVVVVKDVTDSEEESRIHHFAEEACRCLTDAGFVSLKVAYGTVVDEIKEISHSYKEAKMALDVAKIFYEDKTVVSYSQLGIGRLIYQLPIPLCRMFIQETFKDKGPDDLDEETLTTINQFFENNLNVSETSRKLFIHRNTLVYRLDKLKRSTGLDLRVFDDAITFKIALMVNQYMKYMDEQENL